jgi:signal transduction histidine kinase
MLALLLTAALTLGATALALLSPLQDRVRAQSERDLLATVESARGGIADALRRTHGDILSYSVTSRAYGLYQSTDTRVIVTPTVPGNYGPTRTYYPVVPYPYDSGSGPDNASDIYEVIITERTQVGTTPDGGVRVATLVDAGRAGKFVLAVRRSADDTDSAVEAVRDALAVAAGIGLAAAIGLGLILVTGLTRRIERLRATAARVAREGPGAPAPVDESADEVGELARTFASMQAALGRQEEARRAFVATASHELRTPLTALGGTLELLAEDLRDGRMDLEDALSQVGVAQHEVGRLTHLASDLLDLSRLDSETPLRSEPVELREACRAVAGEFEARARELGLRVEVAEAPGAVWARADPGAVVRIVRILVDNALRFAPPGTAIEIVPGYHGDGATVEVADAGPGVPASERERIFARFERGAATGGEGGFGLGLAIGRELAERQGGRLELRDGGPGARFRLTLPVDTLER